MDVCCHVKCLMEIKGQLLHEDFYTCDDMEKLGRFNVEDLTTSICLPLMNLNH